MSARASAPKLRNADRWLVAVTTEPEGIRAGLERALGFGLAARDGADLERWVTPGPRLSALERLAIYGDGYVARLVECLLDDYPALACLLGSTEFEALARAYVTAYPSRSPSLNAYGQHMAELVRTSSEPWAPFAAELAELEWALVKAIHAESCPPLAPDALAALAPSDGARVRLVPSAALCVLVFRYPVNTFYQAFRSGSEPGLPGAETSAVAVHREGLALYRQDLEPLAAELLRALARGETLAGALGELERVASRDELERVQDRLSEWFRDWVSAGFFTRLAPA